MSRGRRSGAGGGAKGPSQRQLRMGELLRHVLSEIMARGEFRDPTLTGASITVTEVRPSPDLKNATVFVTPLGGTDVNAVVEGLQRARGYLRAQIAGKIEAKFTPELSFKPDTSFAEAERIEALLAKERG